MYGDIYRASVFVTDAYVISNSEYCERILRLNSQNYSRSDQANLAAALATDSSQAMESSGQTSGA
jgi:hypothetical protein